MLVMQNAKLKMIIDDVLKQQQKVRLDGFDWPSALDVIDKVKEELSELTVAIKANDKAAIFDEFGDVLLVIMNLSLHLELELEPCLMKSLKKFQTRYQAMLSLANQKKVYFKSLTLKEKESLWRLIKKVNLD